MVIVIDMNTEHMLPDCWRNTDYDAEVLRSGWNPAVEELRTELQQHEITKPTPLPLPSTLTDAPLDAFLEDMQSI